MASLINPFQHPQFHNQSDLDRMARQQQADLLGQYQRGHVCSAAGVVTAAEGAWGVSSASHNKADNLSQEELRDVMLRETLNAPNPPRMAPEDLLVLLL